MALKINREAPDFSLPSTSGKIFTLSKNFADKPCIIYFCPKDFASACIAEAYELSEYFDIFKELDIRIIGISTDTLATHLEFKDRYNIPFELLSDMTGEITRLYEADVPILHFKKYVTYLLDDTHHIKAVYENLFSAKQHITKILEIARENLINH